MVVRQSVKMVRCIKFILQSKLKTKWPIEGSFLKNKHYSFIFSAKLLFTKPKKIFMIDKKTANL